MEKSNNGSTETLTETGAQKNKNLKKKSDEAFTVLERGVFAALQTYSNVHRGSGHNSMVSTQLFEQARDIVLEYLDLKKGPYVVIFCTPNSAELLTQQLSPASYHLVSSQEFGLSIGVRALAVKKKTLPRNIPFLSGGGTAKLVAQDWVIWANAPDRFEAGTPAIINVIAFARALLLIQKFGNSAFLNSTSPKQSAHDILHHDDLEKYSGQELLAELRKTLIGSNMPVPTTEGSVPYINLDNSASTPTFQPIWKAFCQTWRQPLDIQQDIVQKVKSICSEMLNAPSTDYDIIFTSNTTEAINLAAKSIGSRFKEGTEPVILNTLLEHSSNDLAWRTVPGHSLIRFPVDEDGFIDLIALEALLKAYNQEEQYGNKRIAVVALSGASNVLGVCNDLSEISKIVHQYGAQLLVDAAQLVAHRKVDMDASGIDFLAFSAHKIYAPFGSGALVARKGLLHFSATELEKIKSSGEENAAGVAALGKAMVLLQRIGMDLIAQEEHALTAKTLRKLSQIEGLKVYGIQNPNVPPFVHKIGVFAFGLKGKEAPRVAKELAEQGGIGVRAGCHCAHIIVKRMLHISPSLEKFQWVIQKVFPKISLPGVVRVSLGLQNSPEEIDKLIQVLENIAQKKKTGSSPEVTPVVSQVEVAKQMKDFAGAAAQNVYALS